MGAVAVAFALDKAEHLLPSFILKVVPRSEHEHAAMRVVKESNPSLAVGLEDKCAPAFAVSDHV